ncbi:hypothetical protein [Streptomyces sp. NPDC020571]|uniref:hypothetical protein n=1 Tax=Streptomyces sp. NPDC020571 TaxID=3365079 RepID=UPI0037B8CEA0
MTPTWRELIETLPSALSPELNALPLENDGSLGEYVTEVVWPAERILGDDLAFRSDDQYRWVECR